MLRKPEWLKVRLQDTPKYNSVNQVIQDFNLHTVCSGANCPNRLECYSQSTATFMILGTQCTRKCRFCNIENGPLMAPDHEEPQRVGEAVQKLGLKHAVVTSVTRDDLPDGGASYFVQTILEIRKFSPETVIEVLIPDFQGSLEALSQVVEAKPDIINHNIETIERLYDQVRPEAVFERSLELLERIKKIDSSRYSKSGFMVGLGETEEEIRALMVTLKNRNVDFLTIGQYLPPSLAHYPLQAYITPEIFATYEQYGKTLGFKGIASGPLVRSSYHAASFFQTFNEAVKDC